MHKQDASYLLKEKIQLKELELAMEKNLLQDQFKLTIESLKPANLIKEALTSSQTKTTVLDTAIGMTSGYLIKKAVVRSSKNPFLKLLGTIVEMGAANMVTKHPEAIKFIGGNILARIFKKKENNPDSYQDEKT